MKEIISIIKFILTWRYTLLTIPINGDLKDIHNLYNLDKNISFKEFMRHINTINDICGGCFVVSADVMEWFDEMSLEILLLKLEPTTIKQPQVIKTNEQKEDNYSLDQILAFPSKSKLRFPQTTISKLTTEKIRLITPKKKFINICNNQSHAQKLSTHKKSPDLAACLAVNIHYVPIVKPHTDVSLGDCSYLDTCHKIHNCRYLHYFKLMPSEIEEEFIDVVENSRISDFTFGDCVGGLQKELPPQWINCDVRKIDFNILGKFAAIIADPAWNIHMNLPYGTCKDSELLSLPIPQLQDEGILLLWVTGRSIEIGRQSLINWGYTVKNELIWIKVNQLKRSICTGRTGHWLNHSKEHLLVGLKGNPKWLKQNIDPDVLVSSTRETSRKPDEIYGIVERLVGSNSRKLEIFGRDHNTRPGWFTIGNQLNGTNIYEKEVLNKYEENLRKK